jgi:hypothetical protein
MSSAHNRILSRPLHHFFQLAPAGFDEMFADSALLQAVRLGELAHRLAVSSRAQTEHQLFPHRFAKRLAPVKHLVAAQPHFLVVRAPHSRPLDRHLLAHHHAEAPLLTPPVGPPIRLRLAALPHHFPHLFLHQQLHQLQPGLANQCAYALTQPAHHLG